MRSRTKRTQPIDRRAVARRIFQLSALISIGRLAKRLGTTIQTLDRIRLYGNPGAVWVHILARLEELESEVRALKLPPGKNARQMNALDLWPPGVAHDRYGLIV